MPAGAIVRLSSLLPQQTIVPVLRSAQVWNQPALSAVNVVGVGVGVGVGGAGATGSRPTRPGVVCASSAIASSGRSSRRPQQLAPVGLSAQECRIPALTARYRPGGALL